MSSKKLVTLGFEEADYNDVIILMTEERWKHIVFKHGEFHNFWDNLKETALNPEYIADDKSYPKNKLRIRYYKRIGNYYNFFIVVVVDDNNTVRTAHIEKKNNFKNKVKVCLKN